MKLLTVLTDLYCTLLQYIMCTSYTAVVMFQKLFQILWNTVRTPCCWLSPTQVCHCVWSLSTR